MYKSYKVCLQNDPDIVSNWTIFQLNIQYASKEEYNTTPSYSQPLIASYFVTLTQVFQSSIVWVDIQSYSD